MVIYYVNRYGSIITVQRISEPCACAKTQICYIVYCARKNVCAQQMCERKTNNMEL